MLVVGNAGFEVGADASFELDSEAVFDLEAWVPPWPAADERVNRNSRVLDGAELPDRLIGRAMSTNWF